MFDPALYAPNAPVPAAPARTNQPRITIDPFELPRRVPTESVKTSRRVLPAGHPHNQARTTAAEEEAYQTVEHGTSTTTRERQRATVAPQRSLSALISSVVGANPTVPTVATRNVGEKRSRTQQLSMENVDEDIQREGGAFVPVPPVAISSVAGGANPTLSTRIVGEKRSRTQLSMENVDVPVPPPAIADDPNRTAATTTHGVPLSPTVLAPLMAPVNTAHDVLLPNTVVAPLIVPASETSPVGVPGANLLLLPSTDPVANDINAAAQTLPPPGKYFLMIIYCSTIAGIF